jgi:hypothetical protein
MWNGSSGYNSGPGASLNDGYEPWLMRAVAGLTWWDGSSR